MSAVSKRKFRVTEGNSEGNVKKKKQNLTWLSDGLAGADPFTVLKRFIEEAHNFKLCDDQESNKDDIVKEFLTNGGSGKEFLVLLDNGTKRKASEVALVFSALEKILVRVANDLTEYRNVAMQTANIILQSHMIKINQSLCPSSNANQIKSSLRLLTSMVTLGHITAREVISHFDFTQDFIANILQWRSLTDLPDVRSTYILFITSFLMEEDPLILRTLGENRAILQPLFDGLIYDSPGILDIFVSALRDKVAASTSLSKTLKLRIFNAYTNQHLTNLFYWQGPRKAPRKTLKGDQPTNEIPDSDESNRETEIGVAQLGQSLFLALISSHKYGLVFADYTLGLSGKNKNSAALILLQNLDKFWEYQCEKKIEMQSTIIVRTMQSCPDLLRWYLPLLSEHLGDARATQPWFVLCSLVRQTIDVQNLEIIFNPREKFTVKQQTIRAASLIAPLLWGSSFFPDAMSHQDLKVRLAAGSLLQTVVKKMTELGNILTNNRRTDVYTDKEKSAIFTSLKNLIRKRLLQPAPLTDMCSQMFVESDEEQDLELKVQFWSLILELMTLYAQLELLTEDEKKTIPAGQLINNVMERVKKADGGSQYLEPLQLAVFRFVSTLSGVYEMDGSQRESLISSLVNCIVSATNVQLRQSSASFLHDVLVKAGVSISTRLEFNIWVLALEQFPSAAPLFVESVVSLLRGCPAWAEEMSSALDGTNSLHSPLILAAWKQLPQDSDLPVETKKFLTLSTCGLLHCDLGQPAAFASFVAQRIPAMLTNVSLTNYLKLWNGDGKKQPALVASELGLVELPALIFAYAFEEVANLEALKQQWDGHVVAASDRSEKLELAVHQTIRYLSLPQMKSGDRQLGLVELLISILTQDKESSDESLTGKFLQMPMVVDWFDPMDSTDPFTVQFTSLVHTSLTRLKSSSVQHFKKKFLATIQKAIDHPIKKKKKRAKTLNKDLILSLLDLFEVDIGDVEPLIAVITKLETTATAETWIPLLDCLLRKGARLRLTGLEQCIKQSVFQDIIRFFVHHEGIQELRAGLQDLTGVCPEFLSGSVEDVDGLLRVCLESPDCDGTELCLLLFQSGNPAYVEGFGRWCLAHESHFQSINWRVQLMPTYLALCDKANENSGAVLNLFHRIVSPGLGCLLMNREQHWQMAEKLVRLADFTHVLIEKCWTTDQCRELAGKLLSQPRARMAPSQFVDVGRRCDGSVVHAKLCLRSATGVLKTCETGSVSPELVALSTEFNWLTGRNRSGECELTGALLGDPSWSKFLKYSLRNGLRTSGDDEETGGSELSLASLGLVNSVWKLLATDVNAQVTTASQQVYEMISGHSDFMSLILDEEGKCAEQKKLLLQLLTILIEVNPKLCQSGHVPLLLASYQASMSCSDVLILRLLHAYEKNGIALSSFKPYLWGAAAAAHYSLQRGSSMRLSAQPEAGEVVALLESDRLLRTAYHFPVDVTLASFDLAEPSDDYDPRFLVPVLAHILSSQYVVHCAKFTQSAAPSLLFASMSSNCGEIRSLAWLAVGRLYDQLLSASHWPDRCLWLHMIECLRLGSVEQFPNLSGQLHPPKLSNIITLFMAKAAAVLRDPTHPMYRPINNFLVVKPVMDVTQVPEFLQLLHSTDLSMQRDQQRTFILNVIRDGVRTPRDYLVCARRRVFRLLLSLQPSSLLADDSTKSLILAVVQSALRHPVIAYDLILNRGLTTWLSGLLVPTMSAVEAHQVLQLLETLWNTLHAHLLRKRNALEASEVEEVANLEKELESCEADEQTGSKKGDAESKKPKPDGRTKKPIWDLLPPHQQVLPPWLVFELMQVLLRLWRSLTRVEIDCDTYVLYVRLLCAVAGHINESARFIRAAREKHTDSLAFVSPSRTLSVSLLEKLVDMAPRFLSPLPDLKEHLALLKTSPIGTEGDPALFARCWEQRYQNMVRVEKNHVTDRETRRHLHTLIALARCGV